ncbi:NUDIX domain-containing protein [Nocardiopsis changdeensis]|uniref:NUDIX hydrolase n=1 Tax=Nocardiopsis changdeensis TaxID=2831969 RepID=A0ABX8BG26_9ACTN|nr:MULTISPECIES: NUDIX hydrolase [Nocardiopsis]QUX21199.1 NUDIX hydrolase [Nocardiopsis changdeensis]QYX37129.1 NUDIX hydrolase [Nocardiopsis sp. MT53]
MSHTRPAGTDNTGADAKIADAPASWPVERSEDRFRSRLVGMRTDWVRMPGPGGRGTSLAARDYMEHPGAAAALALDDAGRVLLQRQYRHATRHTLWELPAGIIDGEGEGPLATARRELVEEAGLRADTWHELADFFPSPGFSNERIHVFLARGLSEVPAEEIDFERQHEEADLVAEWVPLDEAVGLALAGRLHNGATVIGVLAAHAASREGFTGLREPAEP